MIRAADKLQRRFAISRKILEQQIKRIAGIEKLPNKAKMPDREEYWNHLKASTDEYKNIWKLSVEYLEANASTMDPNEKRMALNVLASWPQLKEFYTSPKPEKKEKTGIKHDPVIEIHSIKELTNNLQTWLLTLDKLSEDAAYETFIDHFYAISDSQLERQSEYHNNIVSQVIVQAAYRLKSRLLTDDCLELLKKYSKIRVFVPEFHEMILKKILTQRQSDEVIDQLVELSHRIGIRSPFPKHHKSAPITMANIDASQSYMKSMESSLANYSLFASGLDKPTTPQIDFSDFLKHNPPNYSALDLRSRVKLLALYTGILSLRKSCATVNDEVVDHCRSLIKVIVRKIAQEVDGMLADLPEDRRLAAETESSNVLNDLFVGDIRFADYLIRLARLIDDGADVVILNEALNMCIYLIYLDPSNLDSIAGFSSKITTLAETRRFDTMMAIGLIDSVRFSGLVFKALKVHRRIGNSHEADETIKKACMLALHLKSPESKWLERYELSAQSLIDSILNELKLLDNVGKNVTKLNKIDEKLLSIVASLDDVEDKLGKSEEKGLVDEDFNHARYFPAVNDEELLYKSGIKDARAKNFNKPARKTSKWSMTEESIGGGSIPKTSTAYRQVSTEHTRPKKIVPDKKKSQEASKSPFILKKKGSNNIGKPDERDIPMNHKSPLDRWNNISLADYVEKK
jgi:hypothetical protein